MEYFIITLLLLLFIFIKNIPLLTLNNDKILDVFYHYLLNWKAPLLVLNSAATFHLNWKSDKKEYFCNTRVNIKETACIFRTTNNTAKISSNLTVCWIKSIAIGFLVCCNYFSRNGLWNQLESRSQFIGLSGTNQRHCGHFLGSFLFWVDFFLSGAFLCWILLLESNEFLLESNNFLLESNNFQLHLIVK